MRKGQGLTEYIIIVALVAIAGIGIVNIFGNQLRNQFTRSLKRCRQRDGHRPIARGKAGTEANQKNLSTMPARSERGRRLIEFLLAGVPLLLPDDGDRSTVPSLGGKSAVDTAAHLAARKFARIAREDFRKAREMAFSRRFRCAEPARGIVRVGPP